MESTQEARAASRPLRHDLAWVAEQERVLQQSIRQRRGAQRAADRGRLGPVAASRWASSRFVRALHS